MAGVVQFGSGARAQALRVLMHMLGLCDCSCAALHILTGLATRLAPCY